MKDDEIVKALECCKGGIDNCKKCPYGLGECLNDNYESVLMKDALDLINRKNAEVERLKDGIKFERERVDNIPNLLLQAKTEAIKEFAERLRKQATVDDDSTWWIANIDVDNLVKEMAGDT